MWFLEYMTPYSTLFWSRTVVSNLQSNTDVALINIYPEKSASTCLRNTPQQVDSLLKLNY